MVWSNPKKAKLTQPEGVALAARLYGDAVQRGKVGEEIRVVCVCRDTECHEDDLKMESTLNNSEMSWPCCAHTNVRTFTFMHRLSQSWAWTTRWTWMVGPLCQVCVCVIKRGREREEWSERESV